MASMKMNSEQVGWGFWLQWLLLMIVFIFLSYTGIDTVERPIVTRAVSDPWVREAFMVLGLALLGAAVGITQSLLLRPRLHQTNKWGFAMAATSWAGASLAEIASFTGVALIPSFALTFLLLGPVRGILQWKILRPQVRRAGWWLLVRTVSWLALFVVAAGVAYGAVSILGGAVDDYLAVGYAAGGASLGAMTGAVLVWLLRQPASKSRNVEAIAA